jgi:hypothetical protein
MMMNVLRLSLNLLALLGVGGDCRNLEPRRDAELGGEATTIGVKPKGDLFRIVCEVFDGGPPRARLRPWYTPRTTSSVVTCFPSSRVTLLVGSTDGQPCRLR